MPVAVVCQYHVTPAGGAPLVKVTPGEAHCGELLLRPVGVAGKAFTVNEVPDVAVPPAVVTTTLPVVPVPTVTVIEVAVLLVIVAAVPPIVTPVAPDKLVPVMVNELPTQPLVALKLVIDGATGVVTHIVKPP